MAASSTQKKRELKQNQREVLDNIKGKTKEVIQNRKNINHIIDIQLQLEVFLPSFTITTCLLLLSAYY